MYYIFKKGVLRHLGNFKTHDDALNVFNVCREFESIGEDMTLAFLADDGSAAWYSWPLESWNSELTVADVYIEAGLPVPHIDIKSHPAMEAAIDHINDLESQLDKLAHAKEEMFRTITQAVEQTLGDLERDDDLDTDYSSFDIDEHL